MSKAAMESVGYGVIGAAILIYGLEFLTRNQLWDWRSIVITLPEPAGAP